MSFAEVSILQVPFRRVVATTEYRKMVVRVVRGYSQSLVNIEVDWGQTPLWVAESGRVCVSKHHRV